MLKTLVVVAWCLFGAGALVVGATIVSRNMGDDAAGRGLALGLGLVRLAFLLVGGGLLYWGARMKSWLAVSGSLGLMALPFLLFFGSDVEGAFQDLAVWYSNQKVRRYRASRAALNSTSRIGTGRRWTARGRTSGTSRNASASRSPRSTPPCSPPWTAGE